MTFLEAMQKLKEGKKVRNIQWLPGNYIILMQDSDKIVTNEGNIVYNIAPNGLWELYTKVILTNEDKEYLRTIIKYSVRPITHIKLVDDPMGKFIAFYSEGFSDVEYTTFIKPTMFRDMIGQYKYTLEDLGL